MSAGVMCDGVPAHAVGAFAGGDGPRRRWSEPSGWRWWCFQPMLLTICYRFQHVLLPTMTMTSSAPTPCSPQQHYPTRQPSRLSNDIYRHPTKTRRATPPGTGGPRPSREGPGTGGAAGGGGGRMWRRLLLGRLLQQRFLSSVSLAVRSFDPIRFNSQYACCNACAGLG